MVIIPRIKLIFQENSYDCGIACLLTIIKYYKSDASKDFLINASHTTKDGTTMYGLMQALIKLGFKTYGLNGQVTDLNSKDTPFICHIKISPKEELYHYVVISNITKNKIFVKDPSYGSKAFSKEEFSKITTNNYLFIKTTPKVRKCIKKKYLLKTYISFLKKEHKKIILIIISLLFSLLLELINMFSLKIILNNAIIVKSLSNLVILLSSFTVLLLIKTLLTFINNLNINKLTCRLSSQLKKRLITNLLALPNLYFKAKEQGHIISLFKDVDILTDFLTLGLITAINNILMVIFLHLYFVNLSLTITIALLICEFILFIFIYIQRKIAKNILRNYYSVQDEYQNELHQIISSNEKIKGLSLEKILSNKFCKTSSKNTDTIYKFTRYSEFIKTLLTLLEGIISLVIIGIGASSIITTSDFSLATFILIESMIFICLKNYESLLLFVFKYENFSKISERLEEIFSLEKELLLPFKEELYKLKHITISIKNLTFQYYDKKVLDNLNLEIKAGDKIFIYGDSGSGKSTLAKLLGRYLPLSYGHIKLNNIDLTHYNLSNLRQIVSYISLEDFLSATTIKDNIYLYRKPIINKDKLLKISGLDKMFQEKNYNLETILEAGGTNLSKGERNRISLAQALLKPSEIYIFDECLSNIDVGLEREILKNILKTYHNKIIIYISHRLSNKDLFNRILYLKEGACHEEISKKHHQ